MIAVSFVPSFAWRNTGRSGNRWGNFCWRYLLVDTLLYTARSDDQCILCNGDCFVDENRRVISRSAVQLSVDRAIQLRKYIDSSIADRIDWLMGYIVIVNIVGDRSVVARWMYKALAKSHKETSETATAQRTQNEDRESLANFSVLRQGMSSKIRYAVSSGKLSKIC